MWVFEGDGDWEILPPVPADTAAADGPAMRESASAAACAATVVSVSADCLCNDEGDKEPSSLAAKDLSTVSLPSASMSISLSLPSERHPDPGAVVTGDTAPDKAFAPTPFTSPSRSKGVIKFAWAPPSQPAEVGEPTGEGDPDAVAEE